MFANIYAVRCHSCVSWINYFRCADVCLLKTRTSLNLANSFWCNYSTAYLSTWTQYFGYFSTVYWHKLNIWVINYCLIFLSCLIKLQRKLPSHGRLEVQLVRQLVHSLMKRTKYPTVIIKVKNTDMSWSQKVFEYLVNISYMRK